MEQRFMCIFFVGIFFAYGRMYSMEYGVLHFCECKAWQQRFVQLFQYSVGVTFFCSSFNRSTSMHFIQGRCKPFTRKQKQILVGKENLCLLPDLCIHLLKQTNVQYQCQCFQNLSTPVHIHSCRQKTVVDSNFKCLFGK